MTPAPPTLSVFLLHDSTVTLWGLTSRRRLERMLKRIGVFRFIEDLASLPSPSTVLFLRGDYLYDERVIRSLIRTPDSIVCSDPENGSVPVAAHVSQHHADAVLMYFQSGSEKNMPAGLHRETPASLSSSFQQQLRKSEPPFVLPVTAERQRTLEEHLFSWSYKGVTDLVTKWVWPRPARWCTRWCALRSITPNQVTLVGFLLVIVATVCFFRGWFGWGLAAGWIMTFLDTVDGKLARVTVTSSRFGHLFDHIIDIVHPPIWYAAWAAGLSGYGGLPFLSISTLLWIIMIGYIVGRLVELIFKQWLGSFGIFCWRPLDSYFRLITGRRNPNLILLTIGALSGYPAEGLWAVVFWTAATSLFLVIRLSIAGFIHSTAGPLESWLMNVDREPYRNAPAARIFAHLPTAAGDRQRR